MIDNIVILFTTGMCVFVVFRAIRLDTKLPWFGAGWRPHRATAPVARLSRPEDFGAVAAPPVEKPPEPPPPPDRWGGGWDRDPWEPRAGGAKRDAS
jgi:hypothetical protein